MSNYLVKMKPAEKLPNGSIYVDQEACPVFIECQVTFGSTKVRVVPLDEDYPEGTYYIQYWEGATGILLMVKYLFSRSKAALAPPRRQDTTAAPILPIQRPQEA